MIGGNNLAFTLLGIKYKKEDPKKSSFLILDPHYTGEDDYKSI